MYFSYGFLAKKVSRTASTASCFFLLSNKEFIQVKFGDMLKSFHGRESSICILLQLLIINTIFIHTPFPLVDWSFIYLAVVDVKEKGPDKFPINEVFESLFSSNFKQLNHTFVVSFLSLNLWIGTISKICSRLCRLAMTLLTIISGRFIIEIRLLTKSKAIFLVV